MLIITGVGLACFPGIGGLVVTGIRGIVTVYFGLTRLRHSVFIGTLEDARLDKTLVYNHLTARPLEYDPTANLLSAIKLFAFKTKLVTTIMSKILIRLG